MARPTTKIDKEQLKKLCALMCTEEEIAGFFDCSIDTINRFCKRVFSLSFADAFKKHSSLGKIGLRRNQFRIAESNATMAIFLGKQYLGQRDVIYEPITETEADGIKGLIDKLTVKQVDGVESELTEAEDGENND